MDESPSQDREISQTKGGSPYPLVSVITPVLNGIKYLETCIQSVLGQSYPHIEHILVDGGSTDTTLKMLSHYAASHPDRIKFISEPDRGTGEAVNKGIGMARGEIFGWLDSDGTYEQDAIKAVVEFFRSNPDAHFLFGEANYVNEAGEIIGKYPVKDFDMKEAIYDRCYMHLQSTFYRPEVIERVGLFNTMGNCYEFWVRVGKVFPMHRIDKVLANNRVDIDGIFYSPKLEKRKILRARLREDYLLCRQHGGSILAPRCRRYFVFMITDRLGIFSLISLPLQKLRRRHPFVDKMLRIFGV